MGGLRQGPVGGFRIWVVWSWPVSREGWSALICRGCERVMSLRVSPGFQKSSDIAGFLWTLLV